VGAPVSAAAPMSPGVPPGMAADAVQGLGADQVAAANVHAANASFAVQTVSSPVAMPVDTGHAGPGGQGAWADPALPWEQGLQAEAMALLADGRHDVWDVLTRRFETRLIQTALATTRGRRIEAAQKLGIGRNTITRKIQELHLE
jgi:two-component system, NtrC family, nitrogen regulation response regulator GlnG